MKSFLKVWLGIGLIAIGLGIAILILAFGTYRSRDDAATVSLQESYEDVSSIDMDINYKAVNIINGDQFSITANNLMKDEIESYVSDGTWYIKENNERIVSLFGFDIPVNEIFHWGDYNSPEITITIPADFVAENMNLSVEAGSLEAEEIVTKNCNLNVDAGRLTFHKLNVSGQSQYKVGTGEMTLQEIQAKDVVVECGVGRVSIDGVITGNNSISNDVGEVDLQLNGKEEDYSYQVSCDLGEVAIDGKSYHSISNEVINKKDADNNLNLDCSIGKITVKFK